MNPKIIEVTQKDPNADYPIFQQEFREDIKCEPCFATMDKVPDGAYIIIGDSAEVGFCMKHIKETYENVKVIKN